MPANSNQIGAVFCAQKSPPRRPSRCSLLNTQYSMPPASTSALALAIYRLTFPLKHLPVCAQPNATQSAPGRHTGTGSARPKHATLRPLAQHKFACHLMPALTLMLMLMFMLMPSSLSLQLPLCAHHHQPPIACQQLVRRCDLCSPFVRCFSKGQTKQSQCKRIV